MNTIKDAIKIITEKGPQTVRVLRCNEWRDYFFFVMVPRRWNGEGGEPGGGSVYYVKKGTNDWDMMDGGEVSDLMRGAEDRPKLIDVKPYLSKEDADFIRMIESRAS